MDKKTLKSLAKLNMYMSDEYNKLSDKLKNTELSHNRKYRLLQHIETKIKFITKYWGIDQSLNMELQDLLNKINRELTFIGRVKGEF